MANSKRGLRIFRRADAADLADTEMMSRPVMDPKPDRDDLAEVASATGYLNKGGALLERHKDWCWI